MNSKGFTLVELLAVIIILSVLALLASTSVTKVVRDSKNDLYNTQIELIKSAAEAWGADNLYKLPDAGTCKYMKLSYLQLYGLIDPDIKNPKTGKKFDKNLTIKITGTENSFGLNDITYEVGVNDVTGCEYMYPKICTLISGEANEIGAKYQCLVKEDMEEGFENGYYFYVLSHNDDGTTNLIMERNVCSNGTVATEDNLCQVEWVSDFDFFGEDRGYSSETNKGPITAMNYLNTATSTWNNIENLDIMYNDEGGAFINFKITGKARMPYKSEVNEVGCEDDLNLSCPLWMSDYLNDAKEEHGESYQQKPIKNMYGYWTLSSSDSYYAWFIDYNGAAVSAAGDIGYVPMAMLGVRPVITLEL